MALSVFDYEEEKDPLSFMTPKPMSPPSPLEMGQDRLSVAQQQVFQTPARYGGGITANRRQGRRYDWSQEDADRWIGLALKQGALPEERMGQLATKPLYQHERNRLIDQAYAMYKNSMNPPFAKTQAMGKGGVSTALSRVPWYQEGAQNPVKGAMDEYTGKRQQKALMGVYDFVTQSGGGINALGNPQFNRLLENYVTSGGKVDADLMGQIQGHAANVEQLRLGAEAERPLTPNTPEYGLIASSAQRLVQIAQATGQIGLLEGIPNPAAVRVKDVPMVMREIEERIKAAGTLEEMRRGRGEEAREEERHGVQMPYYRLGVKEQKAELEERPLKRRQMEASTKYTEALTRRTRQGGGGGTGKLAVPREAERKLAATARGELEDLMEGVESGGWGGAKAPFDITDPNHERLLKRIVRMGFKAEDRQNWFADIEKLKTQGKTSDEILEYLRDKLLDIENMVNEEEEWARGAKAGLLRSKNKGGKRRPASVSGE